MMVGAIFFFQFELISPKKLQILKKNYRGLRWERRHLDTHPQIKFQKRDILFISLGRSVPLLVHF